MATKEYVGRRENFRILIADDDADDHVFMKDGLEESRVPVEIDSVFDGSEVLDYLLRRGEFKNKPLPDLVLLDLNMPLKNGFEVLKQIQLHPELRPIPVYIITTSRDVDHLNKALELGARGFYSKGTTRREMLRIMKEVCEDCFADQSAR